MRAPAKMPVAKRARILTQLDLSVQGVEGWRMYRSGLNQGLLLDLYSGSQQDYNAKVYGVCELLALYRQSVAFTDLETLAQQVNTYVGTMSQRLQHDFHEQWFVLHGEIERALLPNYMVDDYFYTPEFACVKRFISCILDVEGVSERLRVMLAPLWFTMCDAALEAQVAAG